MGDTDGTAMRRRSGSAAAFTWTGWRVPAPDGTRWWRCPTDAVCRLRRSGAVLHTAGLTGARRGSRRS